MIKAILRFLGLLPKDPARRSSGKVEPTIPCPPPPEKGSPRDLARQSDIGRPPHKPALSVDAMLKTGRAPNIQRPLPGIAPDEEPPPREHKHYQSHVPPKRPGGENRLEARDMAQSWLYIRDNTKRAKKMARDRDAYPELYRLAIQELETIRAGCGKGRCSPTAMRAAAHETIALSATLPSNFRDEVASGTQTPAREPDPLHPVKAAIDRARGRMEPPKHPVQFDGPPVDDGLVVTDLGTDKLGIRHLLVKPAYPLEHVEVNLGPISTPEYTMPDMPVGHDSSSYPSDTGSSYSAD